MHSFGANGKRKKKSSWYFAQAVYGYNMKKINVNNWLLNVVYFKHCILNDVYNEILFGVMPIFFWSDSKWFNFATFGYITFKHTSNHYMTH